MRRGWASVSAGVIVGLLGAAPVVWMASAANQPDEQAAVAVTSTTTAPVNTTPTANRPTETVVTTPPPQIEGLSESIVRVLVSEGFASDQDVGEIPSSVANALAARGIALTVAEGG